MRIVLYLVILMLCLLKVQAVDASIVLFHDSFDDGTATDWTVKRNQQWDNPTQTCMNGTQPAEWDVVDGELGIVINTGPSCTTTITPNQLDLTTSGSFQFSFDWHFLESMVMDRNVALVWQDEKNWYGIKVLTNEIRVEKVVDGEAYSLHHNWTTYPFVANRHYHFDLILSGDNTVQVKINGETVLTAQDQLPFIRGFKTVGLMASTGSLHRSVSYFDNVVVTSLEDNTDVHLHAPLIKQIDPSWRDFEYDHATQWSEIPTIGRWGCAVTSMAIILHYYGISHLPNSVFITPYSLDAWLQTQPDGYIGEGLVNWLAITRMTHQVSEKKNTPILEFNWAPYSQDTVRQEILNDQPVIINVPEHFIVGDGFTSNNDILINDPAYEHELLSKHPTPLSLRLFKPSHTDLSYVEIIGNSNTEISLSAPTPEQQQKIVSTSESLPGFSTTEKTRSSTVVYLPKPAPGMYSISAKAVSDEPQHITIRTYDKVGSVNTYEESFVGTQSWYLSIDSVNQSTLTPLSVRYIQNILQKLYSLQKTDKHNSERYEHLILSELNLFRPILEEATQSNL